MHDYLAFYLILASVILVPTILFVGLAIAIDGSN